MKLMFLSNYYTHHQKPSCERWNVLTGGSFRFVATDDLPEERKRMGWGDDSADFVVRYDSSVASQVENADTVIFGSAPLSMVEHRLEQGKLVFKYSERLFKHGYSHYKWLPRVIRFYRSFGRHKSLYLLSASAYTTADFAMHGTFRGKSYRWGYFPETKHYQIDELLLQKQPNKILWCGRFLHWKHPEDAILVAKRLHKEGYDFELNLIGTGEQEEKLVQCIADYGLTEKVHILGSMSPEAVRAHMESAGIYLATSDFAEGWGAVLNEAMNSGCAVVASHAMGAAPYLIDHGTNGLLYESGNLEGLYQKVKYLLSHPQIQKKLGKNAYRTITELWNAEVAAERFLRLTEEIRNHGYCDLYENGPCSKAETIKNHWFSEDAYGISGIKD